jgi:hypothetical protein
MTDTRRQPGAQAGTVVVTLPGEIDLASAGRVGADLDAALASGVGIVIADMSAPGSATPQASTRW